MVKRRPGFTLIEIVIVLSVLSILLIIGMMSWRRHIEKARDAQRKDDLQRLSIAFEEYYSDHECYPPADILENCGGDELSPYLEKIPCDPVTGEPYHYVPDEDYPACPRNFRILVHLDNESDPVISSLNCAGAAGCGYGEDYNYGIASTNVTVANPSLGGTTPPASPGASPLPTASPSPSSQPSGAFACDPKGSCNHYGDPAGAGCPITFSNHAVCQQYCDQSPDYWCKQ